MLSVTQLLNFILTTRDRVWCGPALFPERSNCSGIWHGDAEAFHSLAIAMGVFGAESTDAALLIALAYVVQVQAKAWCV